MVFQHQGIHNDSFDQNLFTSFMIFQWFNSSPLVLHICVSELGHN